MHSKTYSGVSDKQKRIFFVAAAIQIILGIAIIIAAFTIKLNSTSRTDGGPAVINGVYYHQITSIETVKKPLPESAQLLMTLLGIFVIASAISNIYTFLRTNQSYVTIGDKGVSGCQYSKLFLSIKEDSFSIPYDKITDVQVSSLGTTPVLSIQTMTREYTVRIAEAWTARSEISKKLGQP